MPVPICGIVRIAGLGRGVPVQPRKFEIMVYRRFNKLFIRLRNRRAMLRVSR